MSNERDKPNTGVLFVEEEKKSAKHPDFRGNLNIDGKEYWISGWKHKSASGKKYVSLALDPKQPKSGGEEGGGW